MNRIDECFAGLRAAGKKGFVAYIAAGDPDLPTTREIVLTLARCGADVIELGVPFSDPQADGIVNQMAAERALKAGTTLPRCWRSSRSCARRPRCPWCSSLT
nr:tryptophan synthase subunit alpha [Verrucomicrobium spinosum]